MRKRALGTLGKVSELALGTWGLSGDGYGAVSERARDEVLDRALALGITLIETADCYGKGAMERRLGQVLKEHDECRVMTKVGTDLEAKSPRKCFEERYLVDACKASAERLGRKVDVVLLHNPAQTTLEESDACQALARLQEEGTIGGWGVSAGSGPVAQAAVRAGARVVQLAYNFFHGRDLEELDLGEEPVGISVRSVLAHGLLCGQWHSSKVFADGDHRQERWTADQLEARIGQLSIITGILGGDVLTLRAAALRFALANEKVSTVVLGPRNRVQLDQLVREAGKGPPYLSESLRDQVRTNLRLQGGWS